MPKDKKQKQGKNTEALDVRQCPKPGHVMTNQGKVVAIPDGWKLLPPGDAAVTRRVKAAGEHWVMRKLKRNRWISLGVWADASLIDRIETEVKSEKTDPGYAKKQAAAKKRREKQQADYEVEFCDELRKFLKFHPKYAELEAKMAQLVTRHAIPVGSGTVARTQMIGIEEKVKAATIAWMRHQTTDYDFRYIARVKGERREVRRELARDSFELLNRYRRGEEINFDRCPLAKALGR